MIAPHLDEKAVYLLNAMPSCLCNGLAYITRLDYILNETVTLYLTTFEKATACINHHPFGLKWTRFIQ
jgi:hypothetical protein